MAGFSITLVVHGAKAKSVTFTRSFPDEVDGPVAPGTVIGSVAIDPPGWHGIISVDAPFTMNGMDVVVGPVPLVEGTYISNGVATP